MKSGPGFLIIAVLLTFLDAVVVVYYGWPVWTAWPGDPWGSSGSWSSLPH